MKNTYLTRRTFIKKIGIGAATIGLLPACAQERTPHSAPLELTTGYIPILDSAPLVVAYEKGFFKELGIKAKKPTLIRSWPALLEAFTTQQVLLTHILLPQVIFMRYARNIPVRSVAFNHTEVVTMLRSKNLHSNRAFGGKIVGCPTWWSPHTGLFQDFIRKLGFTPVVGKSAHQLQSDEVGFRVIPPPDMIDAIRTDAIAGFTVSEPFGAGAEILADATLIKMSGDIWPNHPCCQSVMLQSTLDRDRSWAEAVTTALYRAAQWCTNNMEELAELLAKDGGGYFPMPQKIIHRALLHHSQEEYGPEGTGAIMHTDWNVKRAGFMPWPYKNAISQTLELMKRTVVHNRVALPQTIRERDSKKIAHELVDYKLAEKAMSAIGGFAAFGKEATIHPRAPYEVLVK